jgi:hypothetical protein
MGSDRTRGEKPHGSAIKNFRAEQQAIPAFSLCLQGMMGSKVSYCYIADYAEKFQKNYRSNRNISIFTSISYHSVFTRPPFLFFQHNQQYDTLLPIIPCKHKLKAGIVY